MILAVEAEFDEPLADIITGMREQHCSWETIAGALSISNETLTKWRKELGLPIDPNTRITERKESRFQDRIAVRLGYKNFNELYYDLRFRRKMTIVDIAAKMGVHRNSIWRWLPDSLKASLYLNTPARIASREKNLEKARVAKQKKHGTLWTHDL